MAVTLIDITRRSPLAGGATFGDVGAYERLDGKAHFAVDPSDRPNQAITDLGLAPLDASGRVTFSSDFTVLTPVDPHRGNRRLLYDVANRGNRVALRMFNRGQRSVDPDAPLDPADGFLMRHGYTLAWCGWQHDVPSRPGLLSIDVPDAATPEGPVSGTVAARFQLTAPTQVQCLADRLMQAYGMDRCYPASDVNQEDAVLVVRDHEDGPPETVSRDRWAFARVEAGRVVPDPAYVYVQLGFVPGKVYQVVYTTARAPVVGLGLLATRDVVSFLRHGTTEQGNPCAGDVSYAFGFGASQSGRFLREFLFLGLNEDEAGRSVFDGVISHIAGGKRGEFNQRFGQPSSLSKHSMGNLFPFSDAEQTDPETGKTGGLFSAAGPEDTRPKVFFTNSSTEYWRGDASLIHTDIEGEKDLTPSAKVRIYHFAGTQHGSGTLPLTDTSVLDGTRGQQQFNCTDYSPLLRAALVRLDRWVTDDEAPPPSRHPRFDDETAVRPEDTAATFWAIPGVAFPAHVPCISRLDFGQGPQPGVATILPPLIGGRYSSFVSAVDQDGNEIAGIRLPDVSVPLATLTGWNLRHPDMGGADQVMGLTGSTIPFPPTRSEREATGDPRTPIEERYPTKQDYLGRVEQAAKSLVQEGYLLAEDLELLIRGAAERYEAFSKATTEAVSR